MQLAWASRFSQSTAAVRYDDDELATGLHDAIHVIVKFPIRRNMLQEIDTNDTIKGTHE
jgi:hypothetical protein